MTISPPDRTYPASGDSQQQARGLLDDEHRGLLADFGQEPRNIACTTTGRKAQARLVQEQQPARGAD